jgi:hypothetical protein
MNSMEIIFLIDMLANFIISYPSSHKIAPVPITDINKIGWNYMKNDFLRDLIPLVPFQLFSFSTFKEDLFWTIKTFRILKGFSNLDVPKFMHSLRDI